MCQAMDYSWDISYPLISLFGIWKTKEKQEGAKNLFGPPAPSPFSFPPIFFLSPHLPLLFFCPSRQMQRVDV
jgi:hypothetical protein